MRRSLLGCTLVVACAAQSPTASPPEHRVEPVTTSAPPDEPSVTEVARDEDASAPEPKGPCTGQAPDGLVQVIQTRARETKRCYEQALKAKPALSGRMIVLLRIETDGRVKAELTQGVPEIDDPSMQDCIVSTFESAVTPPPLDGCINVSVPLLFKPKSDAGTP